MNIFLQLLKANNILKDPSTPSTIAQNILGPQTISPLQETPQDQAVRLAKLLSAHMIGQAAVDVPNAITGALNVSPPVDMAKRIVDKGNYNTNDYMQNGVNALAPIGYISNPLASGIGGAINASAQELLNRIQGKQSNLGGDFASGVHNTGAIVAALGALGSVANPDTTKYVGDNTGPLRDEWIQRGSQLLRDKRFGPRGIDWVGGK